MLKRFLAQRAGATAVEYALIAAMIAMAIILAVGSLGGAVSNSYNDTSQKVQDATQTG